MRQLRMSLVFLLRDEQILLALKKRGFGQGLWNGAGGKVEPGETIEQAARRECFEEIGVTLGGLEPVAELTFINQDQADNLVSVFFCRRWTQTPIETEEMRPQWFKLSRIPYAQMWPDDKHWLPRALSGEKLRGTFYFDASNRLIDFRLTALPAAKT
jgi:8-oxo-dGTP pyrophosphatase MutT (NUDIX family)